LGQARYIDGLHAFEYLDRYLAANFRLANWPTQLANESLRLTTGLVRSRHASGGQFFRPLAFQIGNSTTFTAAGEAPRLIEKAELHCVVAVALLGSDLEHVTRARLHDGHGD